MIAQLNLLAVWAALAPGRLMVRLPWSLFLATLIWYAVVLGFRCAGRGRSGQDALMVGLSLLFGVLVTQVPLWIANRWFRWHLAVVVEGPSAAVSERQYGIRHLLTGMTLLGLALAWIAHRASEGTAGREWGRGRAGGKRPGVPNGARETQIAPSKP